MKHSLFILMTLAFSGDLLSQKSTWEKRWHILNVSNSKLPYYTKIDTIRGDTAFMYRHLTRYVEKSKKGVLIVDGHKGGGMGSECGCESQPHGYWIERYRTGNLKSQGQYFCNSKMGTWTYFFKNGNISKIENFEWTYLRSFSRSSLRDSFPERILRSGPYMEYHSNGQLKTEGNFEIYDRLENQDTIFTFDIDTYEEAFTIIKGNFWKPQSLKTGNWSTYDENGKLISYEKIKIKSLEDENLRDPDDRYWDFFYNIFKQEK